MLIQQGIGKRCWCNCIFCDWYWYKALLSSCAFPATFAVTASTSPWAIAVNCMVHACCSLPWGLSLLQQHQNTHRHHPWVYLITPLLKWLLPCFTSRILVCSTRMWMGLIVISTESQYVKGMTTIWWWVLFGNWAYMIKMHSKCTQQKWGANLAEMHSKKVRCIFIRLWIKL